MITLLDYVPLQPVPFLPVRGGGSGGVEEWTTYLADAPASIQNSPFGGPEDHFNCQGSTTPSSTSATDKTAATVLGWWRPSSLEKEKPGHFLGFSCFRSLRFSKDWLKPSSVKYSQTTLPQQLSIISLRILISCDLFF